MIIITLHLIIFFSLIFTEQYFLGILSAKFYKSILRTGEELLKSFPSNQDLSCEVENLKTFEIKRKKLVFITKIVSVTEIIVFSSLTIIFIIYFKNDYYKVFFNISGFLGSWLAIKTLGNYGQWSASILGRAAFYTFLISTILNIFFGIIIGLLFVLLPLN